MVINRRKLRLRICNIGDLHESNATITQLLKADISSENTPKMTVIAGTLILNAAVTIYLYGLASSIEEGIAYAQNTLYNASGLYLLNNWVEFSQQRYVS